MPISNRRIQKIQPTVVRTQPKVVTRTIHQTKVNNPQPVHNSTSRPFFGKTEKIWDDEVVYLIGGGPSLKEFDWNKLKDKKVIVINRAFQVLPEASVLYWTDARFYKWYKEEIDRFKGLKFTCRPIGDNPGDITILKPNSSNTIDLRPEYISSGNNSGFGAINLAIKLGAKRIYLLGYDMNSSERSTHWHSGYSVSHNHSIYAKMMAQITLLLPELKKLNIEVLNANIKSNMIVFRRVSIESAIANNPIIPNI